MMNCCAEPTILYLNTGAEISGAERSLLTIFDALDRSHWKPFLAAPDGPLLAEAEQRGGNLSSLATYAFKAPLTASHQH